MRAGGLELESRLRGRFNAENILGVVAAATLLDIDDDAVAEGVRALEGVPGRFEAVDEGQPFAVIVDYSHKPGALQSVLEAARAMTRRPRARRRSAPAATATARKRPLMGSVAKQLADVVVVTSDNPRSEEPLAIIQDILQGDRHGRRDRPRPPLARSRA